MSDQMRFQQKLDECIDAARKAYQSARGEEARLYDDCWDDLLTIQFYVDAFNKEAAADADPAA